MNRSTHLVDNTELMAYLDGELHVGRAAVVAAHLEECPECQSCVADLRSVSQHMSTWQVDAPSGHLTEHVMAALREHKSTPPASDKTKIFEMEVEPPPHNLRRWMLGLAGVLASLILIIAISIPNLLKSRQAANQVMVYAGRSVPAAAEGVGGGGDRQGTDSRESGLVTTPMIIRTAALTLVTKDFDKTRGEAEAIIRRHQGYNAQLNVTGQAGAGRSMAATFRIPANQLAAAMSEIKGLALVDQESQGGEEVTRQFVDLSARLANAQNTEQRLNEVLRQHTGKITDILAVENEISRVRGEIERMEAERKNLQNQVQYATLQLQLREEYKAEIGVPSTSTMTQLHNALVDGYRGAFDSAVGLLLFLLRYGPALLFWGLLLFLPARFAWRKVRSQAN